MNILFYMKDDVKSQKVIVKGIPLMTVTVTLVFSVCVTRYTYSHVFTYHMNFTISKTKDFYLRVSVNEIFSI